MPGVEANPITPAKAELGRLLFFDPILSGDNRLSCAHCHDPSHGFSDGRPLSQGAGGRGVGPARSGGVELPRNAPTLWNVAFNAWQFWDGRVQTLEEQAQRPITDPREMGEDPGRLMEELRAIGAYQALFERAFGDGGPAPVTFENVTRALATFLRTLLAVDSRFDRYAAGDRSALSEQEREGLKLFRSLHTRCFECHILPMFTDQTFRVIGAGAAPRADLGRGSVEGAGPPFAFKVPSLRNVELTAPYMHDGSLVTLEEVVRFYAEGGGRREINPASGIDGKILKFDLTETQTAALVAFLKSLTDRSLTPPPPASVPSGLPVLDGSAPASLRPAASPSVR